MALQIRRGVEGSGTGGRLTITPATGELLYTTDTKKIYIGDGTTVGGITVGGLSNVIEDTSPQLGGNLDVNGHSIVSASGGNITIAPNGAGNIQLSGNIVTTGNISKTGTLEINSSLGTYIGKEDGTGTGFLAVTTNTYGGPTGFSLTLRQHHASTDANNVLFYRTRGTALVPTAVQNNDKIADLLFSGHDGTNPLGIALITATVAGVVSTGVIPGKLIFSTNNGIAITPRAELSSSGVWKVNSIANYTGSSVTLTATDLIMEGNVKLNAQSDLRFSDADSSNWVAFQAPTTVATNVTWTLPATDGTGGQVLSTNGGGTLSWATVGGGALSSRTTKVASTGSVADATITNIDVTGFKSYVLLKIVTSHACRVRIYTTDAARTADTSRAEGVTPAVGAGVIADIVATGAQSITLAPGLFGHNEEAAGITTNIPFAITNKSGSTASIVATVSLLQLEA
jgi:hypothetical protein